MEMFEKILKQYHFPKRIKNPITTVEEIEATIHFKIPEDYKTYLQNYSGFESMIGKQYVRLWDINELIELNRSYEIIDSLSNTLGIGGNGAGEFIAIQYMANNRCRIVLSPFMDLDEEYHIEIGTSFTDFLIRLESGQEWFKTSC